MNTIEERVAMGKAAKERVAMGKAAKELVELAVSIGGTDAHFWEVVRDAALVHAPQPTTPSPQIRPMDDANGKRYGRNVVGFGAWVDCTYEHIYLQDPDYLRWLADKGMALLRWLKWREGKR